MIAQITIYQQDELTEDEVVTSVISQLQPTVIAVIRATVESAGVNVANPEGLVQTIFVELRPVVLQSVETSLQSSSSPVSFDAQSLTERILIKLTPFVREGVQQELIARSRQVHDPNVSIDTLAVDCTQGPFLFNS